MTVKANQHRMELRQATNRARRLRMACTRLGGQIGALSTKPWTAERAREHKRLRLEHIVMQDQAMQAELREARVRRRALIQADQ